MKHFKSVTLALALCCAMAPTRARAQQCAQGHPLRDIELQNVTLLDPAVVIRGLRAKFPLAAGDCVDERLRVALAEELKRMYSTAGYGAIRIDLPAATGPDGQLRMRVVESRLSAEPEIYNREFHSRANVIASLPALAPGGPLRIHDLDAQLRMANENPSKEVQVLLKPSERVDGEIQAELRLRETPLRDVRLSLDNTGSASTGRHRITAVWRHADLTGADDLSSLQYQTSPESPKQVQIFSAGYRRPLYAQALMVDLFTTFSSVEGTHGTAAGDVTLNGKGQLAGFKTSRFLQRWGAFDQRVAGSLEYRRYRNQCAIADLPPGACGAAGESVTLVPAALEYTAERSGELPTALVIRLQRDLGWGSSARKLEASRVGARARAWPIRFGASMLVPVGDDWQLTFKTSGQWSRHALVPGEMFGAGGPGTVRGYREREISGDIGVSGSVEFGRLGLLTPETGGDTAVHLFAFADAAEVRNRGGLECLEGAVRCRIASIGGGLRATWKDWSINLDLGYPWRNTAETRRGTYRAHFVLSTHFGY